MTRTIHVLPKQLNHQTGSPRTNNLQDFSDKNPLVKSFYKKVWKGERMILQIEIWGHVIPTNVVFFVHAAARTRLLTINKLVKRWWTIRNWYCIWNWTLKLEVIHWIIAWKLISCQPLFFLFLEFLMEMEGKPQER